MRLRSALVVAAALAVSPPATVLHLVGSADAAACAARRVAGRWTTSDFPLPGTPYNQLVGDPRDGNRLFATDGTSVVRSTDQGCTWTRVFGASAVDTSAAPDGNAGPAATSYYVSGIVPTGAKSVYLSIAPSPYLAIPGTFGPTPPPVFVAASTDSGATFSVLPPSASQPRCNTSSLAVAPSAPSTLYLACHGAVLLASFVPLPPIGGPSPGPKNLEPVSSPDPVMYRSSNGGASWERILPTGLPRPSVGLYDLVVDPFRPTELWGRVALNAATQTLVIVHSLDAGKSWTVAYRGDAEIGIPTMLGLSVARSSRSTPAKLVGWGPSGAVLSTNGGGRWSKLATDAKGLYRAAFDVSTSRVAVTHSAGEPCAAKAKVSVFDTARPAKRPTTVPVTVTPAAGGVNIASLATFRAGAGTFIGVARNYPAAGSPPHITACTLPVSPTPPAPAPPVTTAGLGGTWTNVIVTYRS